MKRCVYPLVCTSIAWYSFLPLIYRSKMPMRNIFLIESFLVPTASLLVWMDVKKDGGAVSFDRTIARISVLMWTLVNFLFLGEVVDYMSILIITLTYLVSRYLQSKEDWTNVSSFSCLKLWVAAHFMFHSSLTLAKIRIISFFF